MKFKSERDPKTGKLVRTALNEAAKEYVKETLNIITPEIKEHVTKLRNEAKAKAEAIINQAEKEVRKVLEKLESPKQESK